MKKSKIKDSSLSEIVVTDNYSVQRELYQILRKINPKNNWIVLCCNKSLDFSKKSDGFTDEFKPIYKVTSKEFDTSALSAKAIWLATVPDTRGDYLAYKFNEHVKKDLKLNCPVYRMRLSHISEDSIINSMINKQNVCMDDTQKLRHESYSVLDHAISVNVSKLFSEKFPFNIDIYLHTGILLSFINNCTSYHKIKHKSFYDVIPMYKGEVVSNSNSISCKAVRKKKIKGVSTLESLYYGLSGFVSWYGFASNLNEAYAKGCITYPTSDKCVKSPKSISLKNTKVSKKNWGLCFIKNEESLPETARYIVSEVAFHTNKSAYLINYEYSQHEPLFVQRLSLGNKDCVKEGLWRDLGISASLGVSQLEILYYLQYLGFSYKLIPWITYSLVKSGLVVYTTDATLALTSFGKFILALLSQNVSILLNEKYIIRTLKGLNTLTPEDEFKNYEFMSQRIDKVTSLAEAAYENMQAPKCVTKCKCGKRYSLTINNSSVFATCSNNKCSNAGKTYPVNITNGIIEVENDK